jgi:catechol 1,2-dioxygenase
MNVNKKREFIISILKGIVFIPMASTLYSTNRIGKSECHTDADVEGPFHRNNAPFKNNLFEGYDGKGEKLVVSGTIFQSNCKRPINGVILDIWHASPMGKYDLISERFLFRAKIKSDTNGKYEFITLLPAGYEDNGMLRPRHIHFKISCPGYKPLTTQLYFKDDNRLASDKFVKINDGTKRAMPVKQENKYLTVDFNIYLENE